MKTITQQELNEKIAKHQLWLENKGDERLVLRGYDLSGLDLGDSNLRGCDLRGCDLSVSNLRGCDLRDCDLDFSSLYFSCKTLKTKFDKKHYIQILFHCLKSLENNDLIDDEFKKALLTKKNIEIANQFHRTDVEKIGGK